MKIIFLIIQKMLLKTPQNPNNMKPEKIVDIFEEYLSDPYGGIRKCDLEFIASEISQQQDKEMEKAIALLKDVYNYPHPTWQLERDQFIQEHENK